MWNKKGITCTKRHYIYYCFILDNNNSIIDSKGIGFCHATVIMFFNWYGSLCVQEKEIERYVIFFLKSSFSYGFCGKTILKNLMKTHEKHLQHMFNYIDQSPRLKDKLTPESQPHQYLRSSFWLCCVEIFSLTHFWPIFPFYTPWKHQKNVRFSGVFRGYKMGIFARKSYSNSPDVLALCKKKSGKLNLL